MAANQHGEAWLSYRAAIEQLYDATIKEIPAGERAGFGRNPSDDLVNKALRASVNLNDRPSMTSTLRRQSTKRPGC